MRVVRNGVVLGLLCALAACTHTPPRGELKGPVESLAGVAVPSTTGVPPDTVDQVTSAPVFEAPAPSLVLQPPPSPAQVADLFDRVRAGFTLDDVESDAVDDQLDWFASHPDYLERAFGRAELYLYHIVAEVEARGMPLELALLPVVESAFEPYAYSRARASGLWQFIPGTGSRFGLKQNWWYDGRRDVVESTRAALDYLQYLHDQFNGDWLLAIAGYNCGETAVQRAINRNEALGKPVDFWSLKLPAETRAYVPKLLAMKRLVADPEAHSITFSKIPNEAYFARVETYGQIDLRLAAEIAGVTHEELYELNPAFHRWATDPSGPHFLLIPADATDAFRANVVQLSPDDRVRVSRYKVRRGDTVAGVAKRFGSTPVVLRELNDLPAGALIVGTDLRVPVANLPLPEKVLRAAALVDNRGRRSTLRPHIHVVGRGDSLWAIARKHGMNVKTLASMNGMRPSDTLKAGQKLKLRSTAPVAVRASQNPTVQTARPITYTVRRGDTLSRIATVFQVTVAELLSWNDMSSRQTSIRPGQKLTVRIPSRT